MKIRVYSDIHLDWYAVNFNQTRLYDPANPFKMSSLFWYPPELPDDKETTLILAGDLWIGHKWIEWAGYSWIKDVSERFERVIVIAGNHDYWPEGKCSIMNWADKGRMYLQDMNLLNVHILDASSLAVDDYIFVGATLWTDMFKCSPFAMMNLNKIMAYDGKINYEFVGDYRTIFTSQKWVELHYKHKRYIEIVAKNNPDKKIIVITHHVPLTTLIDPSYQGDESNAYYVSDLSDLILDNDNIKMWCYGHTHYQHDGMFGTCRLVNNAVGYSGEHFEQQNRVKHEVIEL